MNDVSDVDELAADAVRASSGHPMSQAISLLLSTGVGLSALVLAVGLALVVATGQTGYAEAVSPALLAAPEGTAAFPKTIGSIWRGALALRPFAVVELGVLLLIATPVLRVGASVILFLLERDYLYTVVTLVVLALLLVSIFLVG